MMIFNRRYPNYPVNFVERLIEDRPVTDEIRIRNGNRFEKMFFWQDDPGAVGFCGLGNTGESETTGRVIDGIIRYGDQRCTGSVTKFCYF